MTEAVLRARADTFARYAAFHPETRPDSAALALAFEAQLYLALGMPDTALVPARASITFARTPRGRISEPVARATLGEVLQSRGHADSALAQYDSALSAIASPEQVRERGRLCNDLGIAYHDLGALDQARDYLDHALALRVAIADSDGLGVTLNNIGRLQQTIGRPDSSLSLFERAIAIRRKLGDSSGVALTLANTGYAYDLMAEPARALEAYIQARNALRLTGNRSYQGLTLLNMARAHLALGHVAVARDDLQAGLALKRSAGDAAGVSWAYHDLGRVELALGHLDEGLAWLDSARVAMRALGDRSREGSALYYTALAHQHAGGDAHMRQAVAAYAAAMEARLAVGRRAGNDADRIMFAEQDVSLTSKWVFAWLALASSAGADSVAAASLVAAEQGRARALLDLLQQNGVESRGVAAVAVRRARAPSLSYLVTPYAIVTWLSLPDGRVRSSCQRIAPRVLDTLVARARALIWADRQEGQHVIARVSTMLADTTDDTPSTCAPVNVSVDDSATRTLDGVLAALSRVVLPAALVAQLPDSGELVIVPHAQLALIPFAALPLKRPTDLLGLRYALRYAPSLTMLGVVDAIAARRIDGDHALIVGDPTMPRDPDGSVFASLPGARETARLLSSTLHSPDYLVGDAATKSTVVARLPAATLVHLGTHGRAYGTEARARDSFIVLAGADSSAFLRVRDVLALPSLSAELVVLMACETGLGDLKESEGTSGLQRAFLARGARSVLVSLWSVNQEASDSLMRAFYRNWLSGGATRSKAEALRRAQKEVRALQVNGKSYTNPYYWAGFQVVGAS
jgi:tetratricopeptide (TPR) repeat protein